MSMRSSAFDQDEAVALLRQLVAVRSYPGEERAAQQLVAAWLADNGLIPELQPTANQQPNVIARVTNGPGPTLLLNGHIDTVLAVEGWACDPWQGRLEGERFYGLGAGDMKCGVVVNMLVAREFARRRAEWQGTVIFSSVTDEEAYSHGARALIASGITADACFVTEPSFTKAIIGAPGKVLVRVDVTGKAAHGFYPWEGINAAIELARFVAQVCDAVPPGAHPRLPSSQTVLSFHSGSTQYVITLPEHAQALLTRQIVPGETADAVVAQLRAFAESLDSPARFDFSVEPPFYPPFEFDAPEHPFTQAFVAASRAVLGAEAPFGYSVGVSDANLICGAAGIPCIFYGPLAGDFHQNSEWVDLTSLLPCAEVILATAMTMLQGHHR
jgi:acetylornithine deacetylase/succinyl-diaminopimelate desuccinylase-like protein